MWLLAAENFVIFRTQVTNFAPFVHSSARETHFARERAEEKWNNVLRVQRMQIRGEQHFASLQNALRRVYTHAASRDKETAARSLFSLYYSNVLRAFFKSFYISAWICACIKSTQNIMCRGKMEK